MQPEELPRPGFERAPGAGDATLSRCRRYAHRFFGTVTMSVQLTHRSFALPDLTGLSVQLPLLVLIAGINLAFLDVAVRLHEDEAFYAQVGWNFWVHFGTGVHSFGQWGGIDRFLAAHNELAAAWTGAWPHLLGPSVFSARLSSLQAAFLCASLVGLLAQQSSRPRMCACVESHMKRF